jgi:hypothetical protein
MPGFPTRRSGQIVLKSAQRELNPHFRHGKATGSHYIMGAKDRHIFLIEHRVGVEPTFPRYEGGVFAIGRPVQLLEISTEIGGIRTLTPPVKSRGCRR